jgi:hypothetical protein
MAEHVVHQRVQVARVGGEVVEPVRRQPRVAEAPQVGHDHLEAGSGQRLDVARPDALGLGPPVDEQQREAAGTGPPVGQLDPGANLGTLDRRRGGHEDGL